MNKKQKNVIIGTFVVMLLQLTFFTPFVNEGRRPRGGSSIMHKSIFYGGNIDTGNLILYWIIILLIGSILFFLFTNETKTKKNDSNVKKTIAREFLILFGTTILFFILLSGWYGLYTLNNSKETKLTLQIDNLTLGKDSPYKLRIYYGLNNYHGTSFDRDKLVLFLEEINARTVSDKYYDELKSRYDNFTVSKSKFRENILNDTRSDLELPNILSIEEKLKKIQISFFNDRIYGDGVVALGLILITLFFLFRYLYYATKWSIKQLRDKK
ncbi:hypothetical protein ACFL0J_04395 [Candidatus Neomarinimicrobiota bacterium]